MQRSLPTRLLLGFAVLACLLAALPASAAISLAVARPLDGDTVVSPTEVRASATTDASGAQVTGWQVFVDGVTAYGTAGPTSALVTRLTLDNGTHEIVVTAQDSTGDSATTTLTVTTGVCSGFTVALDAPAGGTETSPVHFAANAASCHRVVGFALFANGRQIFEQRGARSVDTTIDMPPGNHTVFARAWDTTGAQASSPTIPIEIAAPAAPAKPPTTAKPKPPATQAPAPPPPNP